MNPFHPIPGLMQQIYSTRWTSKRLLKIVATPNPPPPPKTTEKLSVLRQHHHLCYIFCVKLTLKIDYILLSVTRM